MLNTDIVASDIPLLLSRKSMKKANMTLNFKNDHAVVFDQSIQLLVTKSGHYAIPINNPYKTSGVNLGVNTNITLVETENNKSINDIAIKLNQQFAYPLPIKLLNCSTQLGTHNGQTKNSRNLKKMSVMNAQTVKYIEKHHNDQL